MNRYSRYFRKNLAYLRLQKGLSQMQLSNKLGITRNAVAMWETGRCEPRLADYKALAKFMRVSMDDLYNRKLYA